jgi:hypothetical protein
MFACIRLFYIQPNGCVFKRQLKYKPTSVKLPGLLAVVIFVLGRFIRRVVMIGNFNK